MLKDITLGQFFPGNSPLHRMDPRFKIVLVMVYIVVLFVAKGIYAYALIAAFNALAMALSRIRVRLLLRGLRPMLFIVLFTAILNMIYVSGEHVLVSFWVITITWEGVYAAAYMVARIVLLISATLLLTYTTSPIMLTDAIERLLGPLKKIRVPVHEFAMMMTIALRFIPTLIEETDKIMSAQKARGADFESGNIFRRAKALVPLLIPLFVSAFRRADELALAMECRCYHGGEGRTRMRVLHAARIDFLALAVCAVWFGGVITLGILL
ncbi:MAG: energy-coupling factor transporter transmembrane protein EcfT [Oscillospiraceae bacterium]|jgi:energy-coupling factor transport system permease protein|nr:energy-coupling factor transporter transmembrane protein EcfT [Oscillospiraceae bacterium]